MAQRVLSISLGSEIVKICEVCLAAKKKVQIFNAIDLVIPEGLCDDGVILDASSLAYVIKEGLQGEDFKAKKIVFSISSRRIASKEAVIPFCKENKIGDIVRINASEYFPIANLEEYTINYSILEVLADEGTKSYRLSVIATPNDLIDGYYTLAELLGMQIQSIDYSGNSILQVLKLQTSSGEIDTILQLGSESTVINIMEGSKLVMQRSVPYGRGSIVEAVQAYRNVPENVADMIVMEEHIGTLVAQSEEVSEAIRMLLSSINRIVEFYTSRNLDKPIVHVYMIGDVLAVNGLIQIFNQEWDHEVELIESLNGVEVKNFNNLNNQIASNYLANIGALLAPMNISRLVDKNANKKVAGLPWWALIVSAVVTVLVIGGELFYYYSQESEVERLQRKIESYGDIEDLEARYNLFQNEQQILLDWYDTTKGPNETLARFVNDLEKVQPSAVAITKLTAKDGNLTIEGSSYGKPAVAEFVIQLKKLSYIENVKVDYVNEDIEEGIASDKFIINMTIKYEDPKADEKAEDKVDDKKVTVEEVDSDGNRVRVVSIDEDNSAATSEDVEGGDIQ